MVTSRGSKLAVELGIFDCDGVLVDSEDIHGHVLHRAISELGSTMSLDEMMGRFKGEQMTKIAAALEAELGRALPPNWITEFEERRAEAFALDLRAVSGAREALEAVRALGIDVCVASQGTLPKTELTLTLTGLRDLFDDEAMFSSYMVTEGKPAPNLFLLAACRGERAPANCLVVEDGWRGLCAARAAGMQALAFAADHRQELYGADPIDDIRDVIRYL